MSVTCQKCPNPGNERFYKEKSEGLFCATCYIKYLQGIREHLELLDKHNRRCASDPKYAKAEFGPA